MSMHYSASQFDHAFSPKKLKNWSYGTNPWPGRYAVCSPLKCCPTPFIACDNGRMFPCVKRNPCSSPWGDYATSIWEVPEPCCCIKCLRHPETCEAQPEIYVKTEAAKCCCCPKYQCCCCKPPWRK